MANNTSTLLKIQYPTSTNRAYGQYVSELRTQLNGYKAQCERSPGFIPEAVAQINAFLVSIGYKAVVGP